MSEHEKVPPQIFSEAEMLGAAADFIGGSVEEPALADSLNLISIPEQSPNSSRGPLRKVVVGAGAIAVTGAVGWLGAESFEFWANENIGLPAKVRMAAASTAISASLYSIGLSIQTLARNRRIRNTLTV